MIIDLYLVVLMAISSSLDTTTLRQKKNLVNASWKSKVENAISIIILKKNILKNQKEVFYQNVVFLFLILFRMSPRRWRKMTPVIYWSYKLQ